MLESYKKVVNDVTEFPNNVTIDLAARYASAFGMLAIGKAVSQVFIDKKTSKDFSFQTFPLTESNVEYVKFEIPGIDVLEFNAVLHSEKGSLFAPPLLMSFSQEKSLVETEVNDDDPVIVERWGTKPWELTINGLLIDLTNRVYPSDEIRRLTKTWQHNGIIKVVGTQFEEKDIDTLYFKSIDFTAVEGYQDTIQFTINASSIKAVNFSLLKPNKSKFSVEAGTLQLISVSE
jgi:hypothetical protein